MGYHAQSSDPVGSYGGPHGMGWRNATQNPTRNNPTNDQAQNSPKTRPFHGIPRVQNMARLDTGDDCTVSGIQLNPVQHSHLRPWHSGMSPGRYEVVALPSTVSKCYRSGQNFAAKYRSSPYNMVTLMVILYTTKTLRTHITTYQKTTLGRKIHSLMVTFSSNKIY